MIDQRLKDAIGRGDKNSVKTCLQKGTSPNLGYLLTKTANSGHTEIVKLLLSHGADPNKGNPLTDAVRLGHMELVKLLLSHGADPNKDNALSYAAVTSHMGITKLLLSNGADPNKGYALVYAAARGHMDITKLLLSNGADPNKGYALDYAAARGHMDITKLLLSNRADPNKGYALEYATERGHMDIAKLLLSNGADPNKGNAFGEAVKKGHMDIVELFLRNGADANNGYALDYAAGRGHMDITKLLLSNGADPKKGYALENAAAEGHMDITGLLLSNGADPNKGDALGYAAMKGHVDIVKLLLSNGADANNGNALLYVAERGHMDITKLLLIYGADPNKLDNEFIENPKRSKRVLTKEQGRIKKQQMEYTEGIKEAVEKPCNITITVVGHKGVGKSCLVKQLQQESIPKGGPGSTDTADFYVNFIAYNPNTCVRQKLDENGEMEASLHRLQQVIHRYRKGEKFIEREPEPVQPSMDTAISHRPGEMAEKSESALPHHNKYRAETSSRGNNIDVGKSEPNLHLSYQNTRTSQSMVTSASAIASSSETRNIKQILGEVFLRFRKRTTGIGKAMRNSIQKLRRKKGVKVSQEQGEVINDVMGRETLEGDDDVKGFITIYDFGGEEVFYNTHHCFISSNMVFVVVFDVGMCLDPERSAAGYEITSWWLKNIATYAIDDAANDVRTPPVILVGSHLDQVTSNKEEQEAIFLKVLETLHQDPILQDIMDKHVQAVFAIANLNDSMRNKELYESIWQKVLAIAHLQSQWEKPVPAKWTALQHELLRRKHKGVIVLSYDELLDINFKLPVPLEEREIKALLKDLRLSGSFQCFDLHGNKPFVILQAQWTIDAFKLVITDPKFTSNLPTMLRLQWNEYEKTGVIQVEFLKQLWAKERFSENMESLFIVMETLNLLAKPISDDLDAVADYYIVPCMLKKANPGVIRPLLDEPDTVTTATLCLKFDNPFIPQAVWDKMIASCVHRFQRLYEPGYDGIKLIQRGFICLAVNALWNMVIHCKDNAMKVTMFTKATHASTLGAGTSLFCILQNLLHRILEQNQQSHLKYQLFLHNNYRLTSDEKMVKIEDLEKFSPLQCNGPKDQDWVNKDDMYVWFKDHGREEIRTTALPAEISGNLPDRKLTVKEIGRVSRYIGSAYQTFLVGLGCPSELLEQEMEEHRHLAFRSRITKIFLKLMNMKACITFTTMAEAMTQNGMDREKLNDIIDSNRESGYIDERLPDKWLQETLSKKDVPIIEQYIGVKAYFNLFLELGLQPKWIDEFDLEYRNKSISDMITAMLEAFISETKPRPTRNTILLAMQECIMDTESLINAFVKN